MCVVGLMLTLFVLRLNIDFFYFIFVHFIGWLSFCQKYKMSSQLVLVSEQGTGFAPCDFSDSQGGIAWMGFETPFPKWLNYIFISHIEDQNSNSNPYNPSGTMSGTESIKSSFPPCTTRNWLDILFMVGCNRQTECH